MDIDIRTVFYPPILRLISAYFNEQEHTLARGVRNPELFKYACAAGFVEEFDTFQLTKFEFYAGIEAAVLSKQVKTLDHYINYHACVFAYYAGKHADHELIFMFDEFKKYICLGAIESGRIDIIRRYPSDIGTMMHAAQHNQCTTMMYYRTQGVPISDPNKLALYAAKAGSWDATRLAVEWGATNYDELLSETRTVMHAVWLVSCGATNFQGVFIEACQREDIQMMEYFYSVGGRYTRVCLIGNTTARAVEWLSATMTFPHEN